MGTQTQTESGDSGPVLERLQTQLNATYRAVESQVARLNGELARVHDARLAELAEKERLADRLQSLLQALPAGVVVLDRDGAVQEANAAAEGLLGTPLQGQPWRDVIARAVDPANPSNADITLRDGRLLALSTCPLGHEPGQIILLQEVTEHRRLEARLGQHRRLADMGRMAATLAHQVRTPLASALLYASHLKRGDIDPAARERFAGKLIGNLQSLEHLVSDMLLFARDGVQESEPLAAADLLEAALEAARHRLSMTGTRYHLRDASEGAVVTGNRSMLLSALGNLVDNALQVMGTGGELTLEARLQASGSVELEVRDSGPGLDPALQARIFEPFYTTRGEGTGLGLAVVRAVARAHQGEAWVESKPGEGARFMIRLPLAGEGGGLARAVGA